MVRYDPETEEPLQGVVMVDASGDFHEFYTQTLDPVVSRFLRVRGRVARPGFAHPLKGSRVLRRLREKLPFAPNLSAVEYVPTGMMGFFDVLREWFPAHRLLVGDFHGLPDAVEGVNAPVVQTRWRRVSVPVSTPFVSDPGGGGWGGTGGAERGDWGLTGVGAARTIRYSVPNGL